ncbi:uncharacterized protein MONBRDRAFT_5451, partial [Monosiga brevicollis MX1]
MTAFARAHELLRGAKFIDYKQLGLPYRLCACEVAFNASLAAQKANETSKAEHYSHIAHDSSTHLTDAHRSLATSARSEPFVLSSRIGIFEPPAAKVKGLKAKQFMGKSEFRAGLYADDKDVGFEGDRVLEKLDAEGLKRLAVKSHTASADVAVGTHKVCGVCHKSDGRCEVTPICCRTTYSLAVATGVNQRSKASGVFPISYVQKLTKAERMRAPPPATRPPPPSLGGSHPGSGRASPASPSSSSNASSLSRNGSTRPPPPTSSPPLSSSPRSSSGVASVVGSANRLRHNDVSTGGVPVVARASGKSKPPPKPQLPGSIRSNKSFGRSFSASDAPASDTQASKLDKAPLRPPAPSASALSSSLPGPTSLTDDRRDSEQLANSELADVFANRQNSLRRVSKDALETDQPNETGQTQAATVAERRKLLMKNSNRIKEEPAQSPDVRKTAGSSAKPRLPAKPGPPVKPVMPTKPTGPLKPPMSEKTSTVTSSTGSAFTNSSGKSSGPTTTASTMQAVPAPSTPHEPPSLIEKGSIRDRAKLFANDNAPGSATGGLPVPKRFQKSTSSPSLGTALPNDKVKTGQPIPFLEPVAAVPAVQDNQILVELHHSSGSKHIAVEKTSTLLQLEKEVAVALSDAKSALWYKPMAAAPELKMTDQ